MNLIDVTSKLATDEQCVAFLEKVRWPNDVRCPICGGDKISRLQRKNPGKNKRLNFYTCLEVTCQQQFTVTSGSRFHAGSYSPDGRWIVFRLEDHGLFRLFKMYLDGTHVTAILPLSSFRPSFIDWGARPSDESDEDDEGR
jgi:hypothetical protein